MPTWKKKWFWGRISKNDIENVDRCIGKGMRGFKGVVHIEIVGGNSPGDILHVGFPLLIVSFKVLELWKQFEKYETYPVVILRNNLPQEYTGIVFLGRGGPFDPNESKAVYFKGADSKGKGVIIKQQGMYFDDSKWDGSDLFTIDDFPCHPIVTEEVVKLMKKAKVTNCDYIPLKRVGIYT